MVLNARRERPVENAASQECAFNRIAGLACVNHPFDSFEQVGKVRMPWLQAFFEASGQQARLAFELQGDGSAAHRVWKHENAPKQTVVVLKQEQGRLGTLPYVS